MPRLSKIFCLLCLFSWPFSLLADDTNQSSIFDLDLQQLLDIKITTAAKFEQTSRDAHASVTVISKEQISQFGGQYLYEVLERVVNVTSSFGVINSITTRGSLPWSSLAQHLALIDGRPFGNMTGSHNLYTAMPLSAIERIEYVRGPGSVLYGTNAYLGVINIVTRSANDEGWQANQTISLGSFDSKNYDANVLFKQGGFSFSGSMLLANSDGWNAQMFDPSADNFYSRQSFHQERTIYFKTQYHGISLSHYQSEQQRFANFWDAPEANYIPWSKDHPVSNTNLGYQYHINEQWRLDGHFTMSKKILEWDSQGIADNAVRLKFPLLWRLGEVNLFGNINSTTQLLAGVTYENRVVYNSFTIPNTDENYASVYAQLQQQLTGNLSYSIGAQYVTSLKLQGDVDNKSDVVPRLGLIYDVSKALSFKLLYGEAYRQPQAGERFISSPGIQKGTPDITSEQMKTLESVLFYQQDDVYTNLTLYKNKESDLIIVVPSDDPLFALENKNQGKRTSSGVEFEFRYLPKSPWQVEFSWALQRNKNGLGEKNVNLSPNITWKLGVGYTFNDWQLGLYNLYNSHFHDTRIFDANTININPKAASVHWLTFKVSKAFVELSNNTRIAIALEVKNILNETVYYPNDTPVFYPSNTLPGREGRSVVASLHYQF